MAQLEARFGRAAEQVKVLKATPSRADKARIYGLFKQAKQGDATKDRPGFTDPVGRLKWDAWNANEVSFSKRSSCDVRCVAASGSGRSLTCGLFPPSFVGQVSA